jgi:hypothetical protein
LLIKKPPPFNPVALVIYELLINKLLTTPEIYPTVPLVLEVRFVKFEERTLTLATPAPTTEAKKAPFELNFKFVAITYVRKHSKYYNI